MGLGIGCKCGRPGVSFQPLQHDSLPGPLLRVTHMSKTKRARLIAPPRYLGSQYHCTSTRKDSLAYPPTSLFSSQAVSTRANQWDRTHRPGQPCACTNALAVHLNLDRGHRYQPRGILTSTRQKSLGQVQPQVLFRIIKHDTEPVQVILGGIDIFQSQGI